MEKARYVLAYMLGILGWFAGIMIGVIWSLLYGGYQESNLIDITVVLMENITPALVSIYLSDYIFNKIFPDNKYKITNRIIFYSILFMNYGYMVCDTILIANYTNIIYIATGIIYLIYLTIRLLKYKNK